MSRLLVGLKLAQSHYLSQLHKYPVATKAVTSGFLYLISDSLVQGIELSRDKDKKYDFKRSMRMAVFGFAVTGPLFHYWFKYLDKHFPKKSYRHAFIKLTIDQVVCSPVFNFLFFSGMGILEGKSKDDIVEKLKKDWLTTYVSDCVVWPFINFVNFAYISSIHRVTFMNVCNIGWGAFLAKMNSSH
ncbi:pmp22 family protein [Dictyostelium discoideum AX4]|uniref:PXMP2/4 family protein 4 n=1 Tax=Dictyostelium discoideum TaxID=44689 RepID=PX24D_DICDI|nr:pmp22 family protein [Dictyostelium discoideum AX4]Q54FR4.1 RecName: Full=PXMP2/4 family protein 4 [Dictyostelium discoideum]EAL62176.1 pmp22 family protein [Dictyostelium discoideum AX4]|eukprot:XP_635703.1 pmp22 family protein [Dictyostelium discoideum AX4]